MCFAAAFTFPAGVPRGTVRGVAMSNAGLQTDRPWRRIGPVAGLLAVVALALAGMAVFGRGMANVSFFAASGFAGVEQ